MSQTDTDYLTSAAVIARLTEQYKQLDLPERLMAVRREISGPIVSTTSFGIEDQADHSRNLRPRSRYRGRYLRYRAPLSGNLGVWDHTERHYDRQIRGPAPDRDAIQGLVERDGVTGFRKSLEARLACCAVRKVEP